MSAVLQFWLPLVAVGILTSTALVWDFWLRRIPNFLTVPAFLAGIAYQAGFRGWAGLEDAGWAFLIGFGSLFLLWVLGGGGAGDVKLMGALGVWLGARMVTQVLFLSVAFVWLAAVFVRVVRKRAARGSQSAQVPKTSGTQPARHVVAFAIPVGLASWIILLAHMVKSQAAG